MVLVDIEDHSSVKTLPSLWSTGQSSRKPSKHVLYLPDYDRSVVEDKIQHLPTLQDLLNEPEPTHCTYTKHDLDRLRPVVLDLIRTFEKSRGDVDELNIDTLFVQIRKKYHQIECSKSILLAAYQDLLQNGTIQKCEYLEKNLIKKAPRSYSGVLVVTVFTSPRPVVRGKAQNFSCEWNCYYCPNEPGQPRSYLLNEPGVRRANAQGFDPVLQFRDRVESLVQIGHPADKVEILVLGGTWESYPEEYQTDFIRDIFYAANTYHPGKPFYHRPRLTLFEEQQMNEQATTRIIGVTLETRPDTINTRMVRRLRQLGCTRVQLGVQHTDDAILTLVNRQCTRYDVVKALKILKECCFKVDIHLMPDLPGATPDGDKAMFDDVLNSSELQADQWKIYPCQTTPWSVIQRWFEEGKYRGYGFENLVDVITYAKARVHPWIRLNRVIRDIPPEYVLGGNCCTNLRQLIEREMSRKGSSCQCIRCREVKNERKALDAIRNAELVERQYIASGGVEYFLSFESLDRKVIYAFLRLRISSDAGMEVFPELRDCGLVRELHVYGQLIRSEVKRHSSESETRSAAQHLGFGKRLLLKAEEISKQSKMRGIAVISGVGVRSYYTLRGFEMMDPARGAFQIKYFTSCRYTHKIRLILQMIIYALVCSSIILLSYYTV